jgi:hypothetical protein
MLRIPTTRMTTETAVASAERSLQQWKRRNGDFIRFAFDNDASAANGRSCCGPKFALRCDLNHGAVSIAAPQDLRAVQPACVANQGSK